MSNKLTKEQPEVLSSEACDKYQKEYTYLRVGCTGSADCEPWVAYLCSEPPSEHIFGNSRKDVITLHRNKYHPDWTPPVEDVWTAEWALGYMLEHCMSFGKATVWSAGEMAKDVHHDGTIEGIVKAVYQWKLIYDPDKPELTAIQVLECVRNGKLSPSALPEADVMITRCAYDSVCKFLKAAGTAEIPDLGGDEESAEPTREETAMGLLKEAREALILQSKGDIVFRIEDFLNEANHE